MDKRVEPMGASRVKFLTEKIEALPKHLKPLEEKLLKLGGSFALIVPNEPDHEKLITSGETLIGKDAKLVKGEKSHCHQNVARRFLKDTKHVKVMTGYALSDDGIWRSHSWALKGNQILETTEPRVQY